MEANIQHKIQFVKHKIIMSTKNPHTTYKTIKIQSLEINTIVNFGTVPNNYFTIDLKKAFCFFGKVFFFTRIHSRGGCAVVGDGKSSVKFKLHMSVLQQQ